MDVPDVFDAPECIARIVHDNVDSPAVICDCLFHDTLRPEARDVQFKPYSAECCDLGIVLCGFCRVPRGGNDMVTGL